MNEQQVLDYNATVVSSASLRHQNLYMLIYEYFDKRGLKWPTTEEAVFWAQTEGGEVFEQLLAKRSKDWVRNNPDDHSEYSDKRLIEEIGDQIFMLLVAGMVMKWDVLESMQSKMERKLQEHESNLSVQQRTF